MPIWIDMQSILEEGDYFNVDIQKCGAYYRAVLILGPAPIRGNTVPKNEVFLSLFSLANDSI